MKSILLFSTLVLSTSTVYAGGVIGGGDSNCDETAAKATGNRIVSTIADINGLKGKLQSQSIKFENGYFYLQSVFDTGLDVPVYTVKLSTECKIIEVTYENWEG